MTIKLGSKDDGIKWAWIGYMVGLSFAITYYYIPKWSIIWVKRKLTRDRSPIIQ